MNAFDETVIAAVTGHMNGDHPEDNLLIARAFGRPDAISSTMVGLDAVAGVWQVVDADGEHELRVEWPGGPISERPAIRRAVVALYRAACDTLGVAPREEHGSAAGETHGSAAGAAEPHAPGAGHPHGHGATSDDEAAGFSAELRQATWKDHGDSEHSTFMEDIMRGRAGRAEFANLVAQHFFMYEALEEASNLLADDELYADFHPASLVRLPALERDLQFLLGDDWRAQITAVPATEAYVARMREIAAEGWKPGIVAHHYTRYLGDLSGGQAISRVVARQHGFDGDGVAFYDFAALGPIPHFKKAYRAALDRLGAALSEDERRRMCDEVREAYRFNTETFRDLDLTREMTAA